jgi:hypothetical protein
MHSHLFATIRCGLTIPVLILGYSQASAQLVGKWQEGSKQASSAYRNNYVFRANRTFKYSTDEEDGLRSIISIEGTYKLKQDTLFLKPLFYTENRGMRLDRSMITAGNNSWEMTGGKNNKKPVANPVWYSLVFKPNKAKVTIELDYITYYKMQQ